MVREVKRRITEASYKKSRLVVQGYNNKEKDSILI
jgi:hypothetical protein